MNYLMAQFRGLVVTDAGTWTILDLGVLDYVFDPSPLIIVQDASHARTPKQDASGDGC